MGGKRHNNTSHKGGSDGGGNIPKPPHKPCPQIPQPLTIRKESTAEENKQYSEESTQRGAQLSVAQRLNWITIGGVVIALFSLVAVYIGLLQNRTTFKSGERAWVMVDEFRFVQPFSTTAHAAIYQTIKNVGKSPALKVRVHKQSTLTGEKCPVNYNRDPYDPASTTDIGPGQWHPLLSPDITPLSQGCVDALNDGEATYKLAGTIIYEDEFGDSHESGFCGMYAGKTTRDIIPCTEGNYTK